MEIQIESTEQKTTDAVKPIETQVAEWSATDAAILEAVAKTTGITVAGYIDEKGAENPKKGREAVQKALTSLVTVRTGIENRRKELKAPILALGTLVDNEAKRLTALAQPRELELQKDRDAYDAEQAKLAAAKKAEEDRLEAIKVAERAAALQVRVDRAVALGGIPNLGWLTAITDEAFAVHITELETAKVERDAAAKLAAEQKAEADRIEAERVAAERKAADEAAETKRKADAAEATERNRLQDIEDARRAAEQAEIDKARAELEAERQKLAKAKEEADAAEAERLARIQREADEKAEAERVAEQEKEDVRLAEIARLEREEFNAAEAARIASEKPDRERLQDWATNVAISIDVLPDVASDALREEAEEMRNNILNLLNVFGAEMEASA
jgi:hypothetical protein